MTNPAIHCCFQRKHLKDLFSVYFFIFDKTINIQNFKMNFLIMYTCIPNKPSQIHSKTSEIESLFQKIYKRLTLKVKQIIKNIYVAMHYLNNRIEISFSTICVVFLVFFYFLSIF